MSGASKITALYERLSRDADLTGESNSIINQKKYLIDLYGGRTCRDKGTGETERSGTTGKTKADRNSAPMNVKELTIIRKFWSFTTRSKRRKHYAKIYHRRKNSSEITIIPA